MHDLTTATADDDEKLIAHVRAIALILDNQGDKNGALVAYIAERLSALKAERARSRDAYFKAQAEVCDVLGRALGYPWYKDDQESFPGATEGDGVCTGDHVAETIAAEAADRLSALKAELHQQQRDAWDTHRAIGLALGLPEPPDPLASDAPFPPEWAGPFPPEWAGLLSEKVAALKDERDRLREALKEARAVFELLEVSPELKPEGFNAVRAMIIRARITVGAAISPEQEG